MKSIKEEIKEYLLSMNGPMDVDKCAQNINDIIFKNVIFGFRIFFEAGHAAGREGLSVEDGLAMMMKED